MRILVLTKRQYTNHDLLDDRYGRLRELPLALATSGHAIMGLCLSYRRRIEGRYNDIKDNAHVAWRAFNAHRLLPFPWSVANYWRAVDVIGQELQPEIVWACSDAPHALLGVRVARRLKTVLVIDLYDNFESLALTRLPGMTAALRRAIRAADGVTCVSAPLLRYIREACVYSKPMAVIENAIPANLFRLHEQAACRQKLGLPAAPAILIGTAGAISATRGIECLFNAFAALSLERTDVHLVLAGPRDRGLVIPQHARIHYLDVLPLERIPLLLSALDISVISNRNSAFGKYCFPQKFYESVACNRPVVAAATDVMRELLQAYPECLFEPDHTDSLLAALRSQINRPAPLPLAVPTWDTQGKKLAAFMSSIIHPD